MKIIALALGLAAAALAPQYAAAHHGKAEEHAQPAASRGGCMWVRTGKTFTSLAACTKGGYSKRACRSTCK